MADYPGDSFVDQLHYRAASFTSMPPAKPIPDNNSFHARTGRSVVLGAEPRGTLLDTTFPLPGEQTLNNSIRVPRSVPCRLRGRRRIR